MRDTIINGTGNSRSLKSVPNIAQLAPTYESLLALLAGDGLPIDIGPLNEAGCQQIGDALNKENLLNDTTAMMYGLSSDAVLDDVYRTAIMTTRYKVLNQIVTDGVNQPVISISNLEEYKDYCIIVYNSGDINALFTIYGVSTAKSKRSGFTNGSDFTSTSQSTINTVYCRDNKTTPLIYQFRLTPGSSLEYENLLSKSNEQMGYYSSKIVLVKSMQNNWSFRGSGFGENVKILFCEETVVGG